MISIDHIQSGSRGNAILVSDSATRLLLDAGLSYPKLSHLLWERNLVWKDIDGILITHEHGDHTQAVPELVKRGRPVVMTKGTAVALQSDPWKIVRPNRSFHIGSFKILPFKVSHDAKEPVGYLFHSTITNELSVYIADTNTYPEFQIGKPINYWIVECNYAEDLLNDSERPSSLKERIRESHMSFENVMKYFKNADTSETHSIMLVHLSDVNSDEERFITLLQEQTGVPVYTP